MTTQKVIRTPELVEEARLLYDAQVEPLEAIEKMLGLNRIGFYRFRVREGWPMRKHGGDHTAVYERRGNDSAPDAPLSPEATRLNHDELIGKLEAAINREFAHAEHALAHGEPRNAEKNAKVMASLVRSLAELKRVPRGAPAAHEKQKEGADEPPARGLAELKAELARRLDRLRRARDAEQGS
jgi:hypothetical protein